MYTTYIGRKGRRLEGAQVGLPQMWGLISLSPNCLGTGPDRPPTTDCDAKTLALQVISQYSGADLPR